MGLEVGYLFVPENELGIMVMTQDHFTGSAYGEIGSLQFYFNNFTLLPYYRKYFWEHRLSLKGGPSFSTYIFHASDRYFDYGYGASGMEKHSFAGIYLETSMAVWERKRTSFKIMAAYHQPFGKLKVDRVIGQDYMGNTFTLLEQDEFNVGQFSMALVFGLKFKG